MADVSKLARERLGRVAPLGPHPDADQLTAFAERTLAVRERDHVVAHLATCAVCREVVALAAPEAAPEEAAEAAAPATTRWLVWPVLRWGAVAVAVVVVGAAVVLRSPRPDDRLPASMQPAGEKAYISAQPEKQAASAPAAQPAPPAAEDKNKAAQVAGEKRQQEPARAVGEEELQAKAEQGRADRAPTSGLVLGKAGAGVGTGVGGGIGGGVFRSPTPAPAPEVAEQRESDAKLRDEAKKDDAKAAAESAPAMAAAPGVTAATPAKPAESAVMQARTAENAAAAKRAARARELPAAPAYADTDAFAMRVEPAALRWTVSSDGRVQRSADGGRTWSEVEIAKDVRFRALAASGASVWAGGTGPALYHSADNGKTWRKVDTGRLSGDVIRLVLGNNVVVITTSAGQTMELSTPEFEQGKDRKPPSAR